LAKAEDALLKRDRSARSRKAYAAALGIERTERKGPLARRAFSFDAVRWGVYDKLSTLTVWSKRVNEAKRLSSGNIDSQGLLPRQE
jgi:hypothetical protein